MIAPHVTIDRDGQETRDVTPLEACALCLGDMVEERTPGDTELVCLQCDRRSPAPATQNPITTIVR
jgi:hypothetical protein